jgi:hypothetical protein
MILGSRVEGMEPEIGDLDRERLGIVGMCGGSWVKSGGFIVNGFVFGFGLWGSIWWISFGECGFCQGKVGDW